MEAQTSLITLRGSHLRATCLIQGLDACCLMFMPNPLIEKKRIKLLNLTKFTSVMFMCLANKLIVLNKGVHIVWRESTLLYQSAKERKRNMKWQPIGKYCISSIISWALNISLPRLFSELLGYPNK